MEVYAVVLAGGVGTRLWPLSRALTPKQLIKLINGQSLYQLTLERLMPILDPENILVVAGEDLVPGLRSRRPRFHMITSLWSRGERGPPPA